MATTTQLEMSAMLAPRERVQLAGGPRVTVADAVTEPVSCSMCRDRNPNGGVRVRVRRFHPGTTNVESFYVVVCLDCLIDCAEPG